MTNRVELKHIVEYANGTCAHDLDDVDHEVLYTPPEAEYGGHFLRPRASAPGFVKLELQDAQHAAQEALEHAQLSMSARSANEYGVPLSTRVREAQPP